MLKLKIKANDITNLTDARYFAAKEATWLTFNFVEKTPTYIEPMTARAIFEWVEGVEIVGAFDGLTAADINFYAENWHLKAVEIGANVTTGEVFKINNLLKIVKKIVVESSTTADILRGQMQPLAATVEAFELDFTPNKLTFDNLKMGDLTLMPEDLTQLCRDFKVILNIDFQLVVLKELLELPLYGLVLKGGDEELTGVKSFDELDEIFDLLEV